MPPVTASSSAIPEASISGRGRTSKCEAGRTSANFSDLAMCCKKLALLASKSAGKSETEAVFNGREDMQDLRANGDWCCSGGDQSSFAFYSLFGFCYCRAKLSSRGRSAAENELRTSKIGGVPSLFGRFTRFKTLDLLQSLAAGEFPLEEAGHLFGVGRPHEQVVHAEL